MVVRAERRKGTQRPTSVRLPVSLMRRIEAAASKEGRSLSSEITSRLELSFNREKKEREFIEDASDNLRHELQTNFANDLARTAAQIIDALTPTRPAVAERRAEAMEALDASIEQARTYKAENEVELMWLEQQLARQMRESEELKREKKELEDELGDQRLDIEGNSSHRCHA